MGPVRVGLPDHGGPRWRGVQPARNEQDGEERAGEEQSSHGSPTVRAKKSTMVSHASGVSIDTPI
jgi:hypothetical protein